MEVDIELLHHLFRAHPWHGVAIGDEAPERVTAYVEIVPTDTVKYELDKPTGLLKVDRPQKFSNVYPTLYGLLPQTYCGPKVAEYCMQQASRKGIVGDGDPLDICVVSERTVTRADILLDARVVGGLRMIDRGEADDKIIAVSIIPAKPRCGQIRSANGVGPMPSWLARSCQASSPAVTSSARSNRPRSPCRLRSTKNLAVGIRRFGVGWSSGTTRPRTVYSMPTNPFECRGGSDRISG